MGRRIVRAVRRFVVPTLVVTAVLLGTRTGRDVSGQVVATPAATIPAQATAPSTPSDTTTPAVSTPIPVASATVPSVSPSPASPSVTAVPSTPTTAVASVTPIPVATAQATAASLVPVVIDGPSGLGSPLRRLVSVPAVEPPVANPPGGGGQPGAQVQARSSSPVRIQGADGASFASITQGCGLTTAGKAYCWGPNYSGQLGDGTAAAERSVPAAVSGGLAFTSLVDSGDRRCGLVSGGNAYCWGYNSSGQLGDGTTGSPSAWNSANRNAPVAVLGGRTFTSLTAGDGHTCGLTSAGAAYCWGANTYGQLGDGTSGNGDWSNTSANRSTPVAVSGGRTFTAIAAGNGHTCAIDTAGVAYCWGANWGGQLGDGTTGTARTSPTAVSGTIAFASIATGWGHTCGLATTGAAYCWGQNYAGQLGDGTSAGRTAPAQVAGGWSFSRIWTGDYHTCAVTTAGVALCWGDGVWGQLGNGSLNWSTWPSLVAGGLSFIMVAPANSHTCGLTTQGDAYCWGSNFAGNIGDGTVGRTTSPGLVAGGRSFASVQTGYADKSVCGLTAAGSAYCWGYNGRGQLGDGTTSDRPTPAAVAANVSFENLVSSPSGNHRCGITAAGSAYCWGTNWAGQVGNGATTNQNSPAAVNGGLTFKTLVVGEYHTCGLTSAGLAYCWGYNWRGQLGDGTTVDQSIPVAVNTSLKFSVLAAAGYHTCGLTLTGLAYCWGSNSNGELGDGTTTNRTSPVAVSGGYTFTSLSVGSSQTCGLTSAGLAYCWGANFQGTLGDDTTTDRTTPTAVTGGIKFTSVVIGFIHTCGLTTAGAAYCWGQNYSGGLGDGTTTARTAPVAVSGGLTFANLVVGGYHTCGLTAAKVAYCWGRNPQLGDGTTAFERLTPVPVTGGLTFASLTAGNAHTCGVTPANVAYCWGERGLGVLGDGFVGIRTSPVAVNVAGIFWAPGAAPPVTLAAGWNHVAIGTYQATTLTAEDVCQAINTANGAGTIAEIDRWVNGAWEGHICGLPPNAFTLDRYTGYFLKLTRSATWTPPA